jgi:uncharacterized repeat protein (TIGR03803 family)
VLYSFTGGEDGNSPYSGVIRDSSGNLYGTTYKGGNAGYGVVYKLDSAGHETVLYSFSGGTDGLGPSAGVIRDSAANLYGTTGSGVREHEAVCDLREQYKQLWESLNGLGSWDANPFVWCLSFRVHHPSASERVPQTARKKMSRVRTANQHT